MKNWFLAIAAIGLTAGLAYWRLRAPLPEPPAKTPDQSSPIAVETRAVAPVVAVPHPSPEAPVSGTVVGETIAANPAPAVAPTHPVAPPAPVAIAGAQPVVPPAMMLENMRSTLREYGSMFGGNPVGT